MNISDCTRNTAPSGTYVPLPKVEARETEFNSADQHLPMGYERQLDHPKIFHSINEHESSKSVEKKTDSSPLLESTAPRRTIRKKQRDKCIK